MPSGKPSKILDIKKLHMHVCACMLVWMTVKKDKAIKDLVNVLDSSFFKALSEPVRLEILKFLLKNGRSDILTVSKSIKKDRSVLSRHLHMMTEAGILKSEKVVRNTFFEIDAKSLTEIISVLFHKVSSAVESCCK